MAHLAERPARVEGAPGWRRQPGGGLPAPLAVPGAAPALPAVRGPAAPLGRLGLEGDLDVPALRLPGRRLRRRGGRDKARFTPPWPAGPRPVRARRGTAVSR